MFALAGLTSLLGAVSFASAQNAAPVDLSAVARTYLESVVSLMETNSINRSKIDWPTIRRQALTRAAGAQVEADTYEAVRWLVSTLGDSHSVFLDPVSLKQMPARAAAASGTPQGRLIDERFGYITLPTFGSFDQTAIDKFATDLQQLVGKVEQSKPCGWLVDLRLNGGGNMWPMIAGIGPILGAGRVGSFQGPDGGGVSWSYENGEAKSNGRTVSKAQGTPVILHTEGAPVAVLLGPATASSGEAIAIAFRGRPSTRFFGAKTRGLATSNRVFPLSDGALLNLTTAAFVDRSGIAYLDGVSPDDTWNISADLDRASLPMSWLAAQPACAK